MRGVRTLDALVTTLLTAGLLTSGCGGDEPEEAATADRAVCAETGPVLEAYNTVKAQGQTARIPDVWNDARDRVAALLDQVESDRVRGATQKVVDAPDAVDGIGTTIPVAPWGLLNLECSALGLLD
jgi:hypothetical protein